jgi:transposase
MERTAMSQKEFDRGAVFERVKAGSLPLRDAAVMLGICYRQAKRLVRRYRAEGAPGLVHGSVGRRPNSARPESDRERVLKLVREHYGGTVEPGPGQRFGPTLVAEHLLEDHGILVPPSTLRAWMTAAGLWSRVRRVKPKPGRRERRAHFGELVQMDGSFHDWFEGRGDRQGQRSCVMNMIDDARGTTLVRFGDEETTWAAADVLQLWIRTYGVPRALYTDWKSVYKREPTAQEALRGDPGHTQFGRMCAKLGIEIIAAGTPQAKGRVERSNGVQQDRMIKKMRLRGIADDAAANAYAESEYLPQHNARFTVAAGSPVDYHLPRDPQLLDQDVFCLEHERTVGNDFVVQFDSKALQLSRSARGRVPAGSRVIVRESREGSLRVIHVNRRGEEREYTWTPAAAVRRAPAAPKLMATASARARPKPGPDHPFRRANSLAVAGAAIAHAEANMNEGTFLMA